MHVFATNLTYLTTECKFTNNSVSLEGGTFCQNRRRTGRCAEFLARAEFLAHWHLQTLDGQAE